MGILPRYSEWRERIPTYHVHHEVKNHHYCSVVKSVVEELGALDVIDFGCGDGSLCTIFPKNRYLGLDIDDKVLKAAQKAFEGYSFKKPDAEVFSTDLCVASDVFNEINDNKIDEILTRMRCKWLLIAEPTKQDSIDKIQPFHSRDKESYVKLMRAHDLLLMKQITKHVTQGSDTKVSFLLFKKAMKNPIL